MDVTFRRLQIPDVIEVEPSVHLDTRGHFQEFYHKEKYFDGGITCEFVQDNTSVTAQYVLRGMHYQLNNPQAKLVSVLHGKVFDVALDIRRASPTFGQAVGATLSASGAKQLFIPEGFAHGFYVISKWALFFYKCSALYDPADDRGVHWASVNIWDFQKEGDPLLSEKDNGLPLLNQTPMIDLPE